MSLLEVASVSRNLAPTFSLTDISFQLDKGQKLGITGASGSGKTTLLKIVAGLDDADKGNIYFETSKVKGPKYRLIPGEPYVAYLSQHYELRNHYRMEELLAYANTMPEAKAMKLFELCKIDHLLKRNTFQLSGGEKQRIALALLLLSSPRLLILDEPFSNLDFIHKNLLKKVLHDIGQELGLTYILASHDSLDLLSWADKMLVIQNGTIIQEGEPKEVYFEPQNEYIGGLLGKYNLLNPKTVSLLLPSLKLNGKQLFLRPEQILITNKADKGVSAVIAFITFWGSFYEIEISLENQRLIIFSLDNQLQIGQQVWLQINPATKFWML